MQFDDVVNNVAIRLLNSPKVSLLETFFLRLNNLISYNKNYLKFTYKKLNWLSLIIK